MRIAYDLRFAGDHFTGIGTHAHLLLEALSRLAPEETFCVLWNPNLRQTRFDSAAIRSRANVEWHERPIAPFQLDSPWRLAAWLRESKADVYFSPFYVLPVGATCPAVLTLHDVWPRRLPAGLSWPKRLVHSLLLRQAARAARVVTSSEFSRREIEALTPIPGSRLRVVRLGTPERGASAPASERPDSAPTGPFALGVSVNLPHKNLGIVAEAWARAGASTGLELVWVGREDRRYATLGELAEARGATRVRALGWVSQPGLEWLYANARMLLFPSRYEGFGLPILEAFARGLPVIAADVPVLREAGEGAARFCDPDEPAPWAEAIRELAARDDVRERMRRLSLERAAAMTYERTARETLAVLREAAETRT